MLYHYTNFAAFDGIIRCAELRLNNILNMNDASEMRLFMNGICNAVLEKLKQDQENDKLRKVKYFFQKKWQKNFTIPPMLPAFQSTEMMLPNGIDMAAPARACVLHFMKR